jgi:hypothetical protein
LEQSLSGAFIKCWTISWTHAWSMSTSPSAPSPITMRAVHFLRRNIHHLDIIAG